MMPVLTITEVFDVDGDKPQFSGMLTHTFDSWDDQVSLSMITCVYVCM
jgi:hypothetical protein